MTVTVTRTPDEIAERIKAAEASLSDPMGWRCEVLTEALPFEYAQAYLLPGVTPEQWAEAQANHQDAESYYAFALTKMTNHRGLSASRSVDKLREYAWLAGRDDVVAAMDAAPYEQYGAPQVKAYADGMGFAWPGTDDLNNMAAGLPCTPGCVNGCGQ